MSNNPFDYSLQYVAEHNAQFDDENWNTDPINFDLGESGYTYPDPQQAARAENEVGAAADPTDEVTHAVRTRSGRTTRSSQSGGASRGVSKARSSKLPLPKRGRAGRKDKVKTVTLPGPLSEITKDSSIPVRDIDAWVNRPAEDRVEESMKRKGYIARPMNSFMLYRSAYAERTKEWCKGNNHQVVSSVAGESWPMEPDELREQFNIWAKIERDNHAAAFPNYKFSPSKAGLKRKDEDEDGPDPDQVDSDAEYVPSKRVQRQFASQYQPTSSRSDSPAMSDTYSSGVEYDDQTDYQWMPNAQVPRPLPAAYGYTESYQPGAPMNFNRHFSLIQQQQQQQRVAAPTSAGWSEQHAQSYQGNVYMQSGPYASQQRAPALEYHTQYQQTPRFAYGDATASRGWDEYGVDPRLTTTDLDAGYSRDMERDRNAH